MSITSVVLGLCALAVVLVVYPCLIISAREKGDVMVCEHCGDTETARRRHLNPYVFENWEPVLCNDCHADHLREYVKREK